jgi:hypothetical protein
MQGVCQTRRNDGISLKNCNLLRIPSKTRHLADFAVAARQERAGEIRRKCVQIANNRGK